MSIFDRRKGIDGIADHVGSEKLKPTLSWPHLVALGVGGIVGTGIYTLTGIGAGLAGPAMILSFAIAGAVSACAALAYAEMATMMPAAGSAYTYTYVAIGEPVAWFVGWSLILEYTVVCAAVAVGWSAYAGGVLVSLQIPFPTALLAGPYAGGLINLPAVFISFAVAALLALGTRESATVNFVLVVIKLAALVAFVVLTLPAFDPVHFHPFMPYGWGSLSPEGAKLGVLPAASVIFFAFYGFDTISTAAEEAKNPGRDLPIGIVGSMLLCTLIYMAVATTALGAVPAAQFAKSAEPLALILRSIAASALGNCGRGSGDSRLSHGHHGLHVWSEPHLFRHGARPAAACRTGKSELVHRHAHSGDDFHRRCRGSDCRFGAAQADCRTRQRRNAMRLRRRGLVDGPAAPAQAAAQTRVLDTALAAGRHRRDCGLPLSVLEPTKPDAALVLRLECLRHSGLRAVWYAQEQICQMTQHGYAAPVLPLDLQRHSGFGLRSVNDQRGLYAGDVFFRRKGFRDEGLKRGQILRHAFENEIDFAGQHVAFADRGP